MKSLLIKRTLVDLLLLVSVLNGWWIVAVVIGLIATWTFNYFIEIIIAGIIFDSIFGYTATLGLWGYIGTITSILIFIVISWSKNVLRR